MATDVWLGPAEQADVDAVAESMRAADRVEIGHQSSRTPAEAVRRSADQSEILRAARFDGETAAVYGVVPLALLGETGIVWLLGTPVIERHGPAFLRNSDAEVGIMHELRPRLVNAVHAENTVSVRWLQWLDFQFGEPFAVGRHKATFYPFERVRYV